MNKIIKIIVGLIVIISAINAIVSLLLFVWTLDTFYIKIFITDVVIYYLSGKCFEFLTDNE